MWRFPRLLDIYSTTYFVCLSGGSGFPWPLSIYSLGYFTRLYLTVFINLVKLALLLWMNISLFWIYFVQLCSNILLQILTWELYRYRGEEKNWKEDKHTHTHTHIHTHSPTKPKLLLSHMRTQIKFTHKNTPDLHKYWNRQNTHTHKHAHTYPHIHTHTQTPTHKLKY